jgi:hypothetical protein
MGKFFDWQEQLDVGDVGEKDFLQYYKDLKPIKSKDLTVDFWLKNGWSVELKTDTYDMNKTPNFFMELYGNEQKKLGGPWRAKKDCLNLFCYYFKKNKTFFWFEPSSLVDLIDQIILKDKLSTVDIVNDGWTAVGYKIARKDVESLLIRKDIF